MAFPLAEVAKEVHLRIDQEEDAGVPTLTKSGMFEITKAVFDVIAQAAAAGETVAVPKFGKFEVKVKPAHKARNPRTGDQIDVPDKLVIKFRPSSTLLGTLAEADLSKIAKPEAKKPAKGKGKKKGKKKKK
jgi:nucleoid DNA-binding protein